MPKEAVKNKLEMFKELNHLSWDEFAAKIGITRSNLMRIVSGEGAPKLKTIQSIKRVTGLEYHEYTKDLPLLTKRRIEAKKR